MAEVSKQTPEAKDNVVVEQRCRLFMDSFEKLHETTHPPIPTKKISMSSAEEKKFFASLSPRQRKQNADVTIMENNSPNSQLNTYDMTPKKKAKPTDRFFNSKK